MRTNRMSIRIVSIIHLTIAAIVHMCGVCLMSASAKSDFIQKPGDVTIGGLIAVHGSSSNGRKCDELNLEALLTTEAMLYAIDEINSGRQLYLKETLGYEIHDTCLGSKTAAYDLLMGKRNSTLAAVLGTLPQDKPDNVASLRLLFVEQLPFLSCDSSTYIGEDFFDMKTLRTFAFHAVPSDRANLRAVVDVMVHFNWSYAAVVYADHDAGKHMKDVFEEEANLKDICIGTKYALPPERNDRSITWFIKSLKNGKNFSVIILLTSRDVSTRLITEASKQKVSSFVWLAGDASWESKQFVPSNRTAAGRLLNVGSYARVLGFKTYLRGLGRSALRNKWLLQMVSTQKGSATTSPGIPTTSVTVKANSSGLLNVTKPMTMGTVPATPASQTQSTDAPIPCADPTSKCVIDKSMLSRVKEKLTEMAENAACTLDAVFAAAHALASKEKCVSRDCPSEREFSKYFQDLSFKNPATGHQVSFSVNGYLKEPEYQVYTYQKLDGNPVSPNERMNLNRKDVGTWKLSASGETVLKIQGDEIQWNTDSGDVPTARCLKPCPPGEFKTRTKNRSDSGCCWQCLPCPEDSISRELDSETCKPCAVTYRPNSARNQCVKYFEDFVFWSDAGSLVIIFLMVTGICFSFYVAVVLFQNRDSPVIRRAKNASLWLLPVIVILFLIPTPLLSKPSEVSCEGYRAFFILALGVPLAALVARSHFLGRWFDDEETGRTTCLPRVVVALIVILVHVIAIVLIRIYLPSSVLRFQTDDPFTEYIECSMHTNVGFLAAIFYLMLTTVIVSIMSLNELISPRNDSEVKWVSLCMFLWTALSFFYVVFAMGIPGKGKIFGMAFVDILYAVNLLACLYIPKWYIVVFQPERNQVDVSPWSAYVKNQNKISERLSANKEESPVAQRRGLASTAKEAGGWRRDRLEMQELIIDTDV